MLHGDFQGGSHGSAGGDMNTGIDKYLKWSFAFFGGAVLTTLTAVGTMIYWLKNFTFAPATMFFELFLLTFGCMMLVLDLPMPHLQKHPRVMMFRTKVYKFALFLTRFIGRGVWYLFLATLVFGALNDTGINVVLGTISTIYLLGLGAVAIGKGAVMSTKLNRVRSAILGSGHTMARFIPSGAPGLSAQQFQRMVAEVTSEQTTFTTDEMDYIVNALAFTPYHDGEIQVEELEYWLQPGPPMWV